MTRTTAATLIILLIALAAGAALAQEQQGADKVPQRNYDESAGAETDGNVYRHGEEYEGVGEQHGPNGPVPAPGEPPVADDPAEKDAVQTPTRNYADALGTESYGHSNRNGDLYEGTGGSHGPKYDVPETVVDEKVCDDPAGDATQQRLRNYDEANGANSHGESHRHGDEFTGTGGPHGPMGSAADDGSVVDEEYFKTFGMEEVLGEAMDGTFAGEMLRYDWGPGDSELDKPFGPNDGVGYGPAGTSGAGTEAPGASGDDVVGDDRGARAGRR